MDRYINRTAYIVDNWKSELARMPEEVRADPKAVLREQYDYLMKGRYRMGIDLSPTEKVGLGLLVSLTDRLRKQLYPNLLTRTFARLKEQLVDRPRYQREYQAFKQDNLRSLEAMLREKGYFRDSDSLEKILEYEENTQNLKFTAELSKDETLELVLVFRKDRNDAFDLYSVVGTVRGRELGSERSHRFSAGENPPEFLQVKNLLQGRSVFRRDSGSWLRLDIAPGQREGEMRVYRKDYGFDLNAELARLYETVPVAALVAKETLARLEQGGQVSFRLPAGEREMVSIEADPKHRCLLVRDGSGNMVPAAQLEHRMHCKPMENMLDGGKKTALDNAKENGIGL